MRDFHEAGADGEGERLGGLASPFAEARNALAASRVAERLAARDHTLWSPEPNEISNRLGWLDLPASMAAAAGPLAALREEVRREGLENVLLFGMGGSSLAPEVFARTFPDAEGLSLSILDSTVPADVLRAASAHDPAKTLHIVSTKSGTTPETLSLMRFFHRRAVEALGERGAGRRFLAITDPGSPLVAEADRLGFRPTILNPPDVGGRYAALSYVGLLPAALAGIDVGEILRRARDDGFGPGVRLGALLGSAALAGRDKLTLLLSPRIASFGDWVEQLVAESTGKSGKGILPVVGEPLEISGRYADDRLFVALLLAEDHSFDAGLDALAEAGRPVSVLRFADRYDLGAQFLRWEIATAVAGHLMNIHPFDQPDVESAKARSREVLAAFRRTGALPEERPELVDGEIAAFGARDTDAPGALAHFLDGLGPGGYVAIQAYLPRESGVAGALENLRRAVRTRTGAAVTVGWGPRFLHSTGQLHKGDGGRGLFVQFTASDPVDVAIPDGSGESSPVTFGLFKDAQALGDAQALADAGRRVARFRFGGAPVPSLERLAGM
jgi:glucose-6-phosphate isomerase